MTDTPRSGTGVIARSAAAVGAAVMLSRVLGLVREQVFAALFGSGMAYDAYVVAYRIPGLLRELLAEGALSAAIVTVFTEVRQAGDPQRLRRLSATVFCAAVLVMGPILAIGALWAGDIVGLMAPDFSQIPGKAQLTARMAAIMLPFLLLLALSAVAMGVLNTCGHFFVPSLSSSFFNLGSVLAGLLLVWVAGLAGYPAIVGMAGGVVVGGMLQFLVQVPSLKREGFSLSAGFDFSDPALRRILALMVPAVVGLAGDKINLFVNTYFASGCGEGSVSWLNYAFRLLVLPVGLVGVSLSIAAAPVLSGQAASGDLPALNRTMTSSLILSLLLSIPATFGLIGLSRPIIRLIFEYGRFTAADTRQTADALVFYAVGIFAYAAVRILVPGFYALGRTFYPVAGSLLTVGLNFLLVKALLPILAFKAVALSTSLCVIANSLFLLAVFQRQAGGVDCRRLGAALLRILPLAAAMGAAAAWIESRLALLLPVGLPGRLVALGGAIGAGILFYLLAIGCSGIAEVRLMRDWARTRWRGMKSAC
jgi:putative peptidoglycan lipid II flippase